jgi:hypothetical protein
MGIEMPAEVRWLIPIVVGDSWPEGDETALQRLAEVWTQAASDVDEAMRQAEDAVRQATSHMDGEAAEAFKKYWEKFVKGEEATLPKMKDVSEKLATACRNCAMQIEYAKLSIIIALVILAIQIAVMIASAVATFGASTAGIVPAQLATRAGVQIVFRQLVQQLMQQVGRNLIGKLAMQVGIEVATSVATDLAVQGIQLAKGTRDSLDTSMTLDAAKSGLISGVVGAGVGAGMGKALGDGLGDSIGKSIGRNAAEEAIIGAGSALAEGALSEEGIKAENVLFGATSGAVSGSVSGLKSGIEGVNADIEVPTAGDMPRPSAGDAPPRLDGPSPATAPSSPASPASPSSPGSPSSPSSSDSEAPPRRSSDATNLSYAAPPVEQPAHRATPDAPPASSGATPPPSQQPQPAPAASAAPSAPPSGGSPSAPRSMPAAPMSAAGFSPSGGPSPAGSGHSVSSAPPSGGHSPSAGGPTNSPPAGHAPSNPGLSGPSPTGSPAHGNPPPSGPSVGGPTHTGPTPGGPAPTGPLPGSNAPGGHTPGGHAPGGPVPGAQGQAPHQGLPGAAPLSTPGSAPAAFGGAPLGHNPTGQHAPAPNPASTPRTPAGDGVQQAAASFVSPAPPPLNRGNADAPSVPQSQAPTPPHVPAQQSHAPATSPQQAPRHQQPPAPQHQQSARQPQQQRPQPAPRQPQPAATPHHQQRSLPPQQPPTPQHGPLRQGPHLAAPHQAAPHQTAAQHASSQQQQTGPHAPDSGLPRPAAADAPTPHERPTRTPMEEYQRRQRAVSLPDHMKHLQSHAAHTRAGLSLHEGAGLGGDRVKALPYSAMTVAPDPHRYTVDIHGSTDSARIGDVRLTPKDVADIIRASGDWDGQQPIRLLSCQTGTKPDGFAAQLSKELGVEVLAPTKDAWVDDMGNVFASSTHHDPIRGDNSPGWPPNGDWVTFKPDGTSTKHDRPVPPGSTPTWGDDAPEQKPKAWRRGEPMAFVDFGDGVWREVPASSVPPPHPTRGNVAPQWAPNQQYAPPPPPQGHPQGPPPGGVPRPQGPTQHGPIQQQGPAQHGPTRQDPIQHGQSQQGPVQHNPTRHGPGQPGPSQHGPAQRGPVDHGSAPRQQAPIQHGPTQHGPTQHGLVQHGPVQQRPVQQGPGQHGPAPRGSMPPQGGPQQHLRPQDQKPPQAGPQPAPGQHRPPQQPQGWPNQQPPRPSQALGGHQQAPRPPAQHPAAGQRPQFAPNQPRRPMAPPAGHPQQPRPMAPNGPMRPNTGPNQRVHPAPSGYDQQPPRRPADHAPARPPQVLPDQQASRPQQHFPPTAPTPVKHTPPAQHTPPTTEPAPTAQQPKPLHEMSESEKYQHALEVYAAEHPELTKREVHMATLGWEVGPDGRFIEPDLSPVETKIARWKQIQQRINDVLRADNFHLERGQIGDGHRDYSNEELDFEPGGPLPGTLTRNPPGGLRDGAAVPVDISRIPGDPVYNDRASDPDYLRKPMFRMDDHDHGDAGIVPQDPTNLDWEGHVGNSAIKTGHVSFSENLEHVATRNNMFSDVRETDIPLGDGRYKRIQYIKEAYPPVTLSVDASFRDRGVYDSHNEGEEVAPGGVADEYVYRTWERVTIFEPPPPGSGKLHGKIHSQGVDEPIVNPNFKYLEEMREIEG